MSLFDDLYNEGINVKIASFWDGGWTAGIGDDLDGCKLKTAGLANWEQVEWWICEAVAQLYPESAFAKKHPPGEKESATSRAARHTRAATVRSRAPAGRRAAAAARHVPQSQGRTFPAAKVLRSPHNRDSGNA